MLFDCLADSEAKKTFGRLSDIWRKEKERKKIRQLSEEETMMTMMAMMAMMA